MLKKIFAGIIVLALALSMCIIPASADDFGATCFFDAEYKDGSLEDKYGAHTYDFSGAQKMENYYDGPAIEIKEVTDDDGNKFKAAVFAGSGIEYLHYQNEGDEKWTADPGFEKLNANFTMEIYAKITNTGWGLVAGTWFENSLSTAGWGIQMGYNSAIQGGIGQANQISVIDANGDFTQSGTVHTTLKGGKARNKWFHMVLVNEGAKNTLYVNGQCIGTEDAATLEHYDCISDITNSGFRVGSYRPATDQFSINMECAYVRLYGAPATAEQAAALYANKVGAAPSGNAPDSAPSNPTKAPDSSNPTDAPKPGDSTDAPAGPTQAPATPTQAPVNPPKTFDLGIVSIAAMSLSSLVVLKKKKK